MYGVEAYAFFLQAEDGIRDYKVTGVQTCALPILKEAGVDISSHRSKHVLQLVHVLGSVRRDIDAGLLHHRDRTRDHPVRRSEERRVGKERRCQREATPRNRTEERRVGVERENKKT